MKLKDTLTCALFVAARLAILLPTSCSWGQSTGPGPGGGYTQIATGAYSVVAEIQAKPGKEEELRSVTLPLVQLVRSDPKNLVYFLQEDREKPGHFVFFEVYASRQDFEAHNNKPYVQTWFAKLPSLTVGSLKTMKMKVLDGPGK